MSFLLPSTQLWPSSTDNDTKNKKALAEAEDVGDAFDIHHFSALSLSETGELKP